MTDGILERPRRLTHDIDRSGFTSGADDLDIWFHKYAWQNQTRHNCVVYVTLHEGAVMGYYALAAASVRADETDPVFAKHRPDPIPCILLARLAVDRRAQGQNVGAALLADAITRVVAAAGTIGAAGLLIHCRDQRAKEFYQHLTPAIESTVSPLQLVIPLHALETGH